LKSGNDQVRHIKEGGEKRDPYKDKLKRGFGHALEPQSKTKGKHSSKAGEGNLSEQNGEREKG